MILANLRLMLSLRFSGKNAGVAQKTSENKPDPRTGHAREGVRHPKHRLGSPPGARDGQSGQVKTSLRSQCLIFTIFTRLVNFTSPLRSSAQTTQVWLDPHNAPRIAIVFHTM